MHLCRKKEFNTLNSAFTGDRVWAYDTQICRSMGASYTNEQITYHGLTGHTFELDINEDINVKKCYCRSEKSCPPKGTFDLYRCTGVPMYGSLPHFYKAEHLLQGIESGLNPNHKDHAIVANVEIVCLNKLNRPCFSFHNFVIFLKMLLFTS